MPDPTTKPTTWGEYFAARKTAVHANNEAHAEFAAAGDRLTECSSLMKELEDLAAAADKVTPYTGDREASFGEAGSPGKRAAAEIEAELEEVGTARSAIREANKVGRRLARAEEIHSSHREGGKTREAVRTLHLLGYDGDTLAELYDEIKRTADLGNAVSRELLRQDEAAKRAKIDEAG